MCDSIVAYTHVTTYYDGEYLTDFRSHPETFFILVKVNASGRYIANKHFHVFPADNGRIIKVFSCEHQFLCYGLLCDILQELTRFFAATQGDID